MLPILGDFVANVFPNLITHYNWMDSVCFPKKSRKIQKIEDDELLYNTMKFLIVILT